MFLILAIAGLVFVIVVSIKEIFSKRNMCYIKREKPQKKSA